MIRQRRSIGLMVFLRGRQDPDEGLPGCANYDKYYGGCVFRKDCLVEQNKRCKYFEVAVLPSAKDIGLQAMVSKLYADHVGCDDIPSGQDRRCGCGAGLRPRQRQCSECSEKSRRESNKASQRKYRELAGSNVSS